MQQVLKSPHLESDKSNLETYSMMNKKPRFLGNNFSVWVKVGLDGAEVSASGWGSEGPRFQSHPRLTSQSCSRYQLNQLGRKAASESTFDQKLWSTVEKLAGYQIIDFTFTLLMWRLIVPPWILQFSTITKKVYNKSRILTRYGQIHPRSIRVDIIGLLEENNGAFVPALILDPEVT